MIDRLCYEKYKNIVENVHYPKCLTSMTTNNVNVANSLREEFGI